MMNGVLRTDSGDDCGYEHTESHNYQNADDLGICLFGGAFKFSVIRDMLSQNPSYNHPVSNHIMSGRRFDQILNYLSVQYTNRYNNEVIRPMIKVQPLFDT